MFLIGGGYGFNAAQNKKLSFPFLTVVEVDSLVYAMENSLPFKNYFHQITDSAFANNESALLFRVKHNWWDLGVKNTSITTTDFV